MCIVSDIRGDEDIPYTMLNKFTILKITKTQFKLNEEILFISIGMFLFGMLIIIPQIIKKKFWIKSTGTIIGFRYLSKVTTIYISHILENGKRIVAEFSVISLGASPYLQKEGEEVEISYSRRNPKKVDILSSKADIIIGIFILSIGVCMMISLY